MTPLFEAIVKHVPPPPTSPEPFFQMLVSNLDYSYLGRIALGRIVSGRVSVGDSIVCIHRDGRRERANVTGLFTFAGMGQVELKLASVGDIIGLIGFEGSLHWGNADRSRGTSAAPVCRYRSAHDPVAAAGLAPGNMKESALAATLGPGLYTAILAGVDDGTGVGLVEVYDRGSP
jgi:translation elongation factor EF-4